MDRTTRARLKPGSALGRIRAFGKQQLGLDVCDMRLLWIDEQLLPGARMYLEVERAGRRVLPRLRGS